MRRTDKNWLTETIIYAVAMGGSIGYLIVFIILWACGQS